MAPCQCPHALGDPRALEGRSGRGRGGRELAVGGQDNFAVGANVDQSVGAAESANPVARIPATVSPPTKPPMTGST